MLFQSKRPFFLPFWGCFVLHSGSLRHQKYTYNIYEIMKLVDQIPKKYSTASSVKDPRCLVCGVQLHALFFSYEREVFHAASVVLVQPHHG